MTRRMPALPWIAALALQTPWLAACGDPPPSPAGEGTTAVDPGDEDSLTTGSAGTSTGTTVGAPEDPTQGQVDGTATTAGDDDGPGIKLDVGGGQSGNEVQLEGRVLAPNGEIPISGALVTLTTQPPPGIPDGVYCEECQAPGTGEFATLTEPDGTFALIADADVFEGNDAYLMVRKGQFMRVSAVTVHEGEQAIDEALTQLPGVDDPATGRWIPQIAVYNSSPDAVYNVLAKFGLGQVSAAGTLVTGTEQFSLLSNDQGTLLDSLEQMSQYHIIFIPCAIASGWPGSPNVPDNRIQNIRDYVAAGGRIYVTDWSNEYAQQPFPTYFDLYASGGGSSDLGSYTVTGTVADPELLAWLDALPPELKDIGGGNPTLNTLPSVELRSNYSGIEAVNDVFVPDDQGNPVNVGPRTWISGPCTSCTANPAINRPMAISGQYGCGRMMFSTFETSSSAYPGLNPQELVLLYLILEIGVCQDELLPPPPQ